MFFEYSDPKPCEFIWFLRSHLLFFPPYHHDYCLISWCPVVCDTVMLCKLHELLWIAMQSCWRPMNSSGPWRHAVAMHETERLPNGGCFFCAIRLNTSLVSSTPSPWQAHGPKHKMWFCFTERSEVEHDCRKHAYSPIVFTIAMFSKGQWCVRVYARKTSIFGSFLRHGINCREQVVGGSTPPDFLVYWSPPVHWSLDALFPPPVIALPLAALVIQKLIAHKSRDPFWSKALVILSNRVQGCFNTISVYGVNS